MLQQRKESNPKNHESNIESMEIDIGNGTKDIIPFSPESNPEEIAHIFCEKHNLSLESQEKIAKQIEVAIKEDRKEEEKLFSSSENIDDEELQKMDVGNNNIKAIPSFEVKARAVKEKVDDNWESIIKKKLIEIKKKEAELTSSANKLSPGQSILFGNMQETTRIPSPESIIIVNNKIGKSLSSNFPCSQGKKESRTTRLYKSALKKIESMKSIAIAKRKEKQIMEMQGVTFTPKINKVTRIKRKDGTSPKKVGDRLYDYVKINGQKLDVIKNSSFDAIISKFTYQPHIEPKYCVIYMYSIEANKSIDFLL